MRNNERYFFTVQGLALILALSACSIPLENIEGKQKPDISAIPVPQNVNAQAKTASRIDLGWQADPTAASYSVYRSTAEDDDDEDGSYPEIATVKQNSYIDDSVSANAVYFYYITLSANNRGESGKSEIVRANTILPAVPQGLSDCLNITFTS
jgi:fibronectin type 3 domain-containing protein